MALASTRETAQGGDNAGPRRRAGLGARLEQIVGGLVSVVDELDPDRLDGADARELYRSFAGAERLVQAGKALLAPRIEATGVWKEGGHRDAATLLAELDGVSPGEARRTLEVGRRLSALPGTEETMRRGTLSQAKLTELTGAGIADPARERELLDGAEAEPLAEVRERCRRARASAAGADPVAATRAIHARRHFSWWTDPEGAFCYQGRDTADRGAKLLAHLGPMAKAIRRARRQAGAEPETEAALRADALFALVTRGDGPGAPSTDPDTGEDLDEGEAPDGEDHAGPGAEADPGEEPIPGTPGPMRWPSSSGPRRRRWWCGWTSRPSGGGWPNGARSARWTDSARCPSPWPGIWPTTRSSPCASTGPGTSGRSHTSGARSTGRSAPPSSSGTASVSSPIAT